MAGILDRFLSILDSKDQTLSDSGPVGMYTGKDLSPSVTERKLHAPTKEEITRSEAEKDAITGPTISGISIDPTDYIGPGTFAKVGATLKAAVSGATATPLVVAAFRSANNTMLSREYQGYLKKGIQNTVADLDYVGEFNPVGKGLLRTLTEKVSDKEISKYGTPEFAVDKWLHSSTNFGTRIPGGVEVVNKKQVLDEATNVMRWNTVKAELIKALPNTPEVDRPIHESVIAKADSAILKHPGTKLAEDFFLAQKQGKELLISSNIRYPGDDLQTGLQNLTRSMQGYGLTSTDIKDKSLQQITALVHRKDDEVIKVMKKSLEHKNQIISKRTGELFNSQRDPDAGMFVRLESPKDLAQETDVLNHCIGAVGRDNGKYIPAFDTVTGKANKGMEAGDTSFAQYKRGMETGTSEFYSFRPKGTPEFTIEVGVAGGQRQLRQAYGFEDAPLTEKQAIELERFLSVKHIDFNKSDVGNIQPIIDDAGGMDWVPE